MERKKNPAIKKIMTPSTEKKLLKGIPSGAIEKTVINSKPTNMIIPAIIPITTIFVGLSVVSPKKIDKKGVFKNIVIISFYIMNFIHDLIINSFFTNTKPIFK